MMPGNGQVTVPPGFRFHPTDEELLYYYLKKKVSYEAIDLDVIREVDLNRLEPWDLKEKCRIGSGPQNEWYFFSHKDKKYPTGTRTNRATAAGFWKATGRDKAIYMGNAKRIGMRKTLVFYTGRAPHGHKTDWIMHEYRLDDDDPQLQQEDGWVVCRVFKKKNHGRGSIQPELQQEDDYDHNPHIMKPGNGSTTMVPHLQPPRQHNYMIQPLMFANLNNNFTHTTTFDGTMHLPQLSSPDNPVTANTIDNLLRLTSGAGTPMGVFNAPQSLVNGGTEWGFLDKLLTNYQSLEPAISQNKVIIADHHDIAGTSSTSSGIDPNKFPFQYLGSESDLLKFPK